MWIQWSLNENFHFFPSLTISSSEYTKHLSSSLQFFISHHPSISSFLKSSIWENRKYSSWPAWKICSFISFESGPIDHLPEGQWVFRKLILNWKIKSPIFSQSKFALLSLPFDKSKFLKQCSNKEFNQMFTWRKLSCSDY